MNVRASRVITGDSAEVFRELKKPHVMAAVWSGAWSDIAMEFVAELLEMPAYKNLKHHQVPILSIPEITRPTQENARIFCREKARFEIMFQSLGVELCHHKTFYDGSRIEPFIMRPDDGDLHVDGPKMNILAVPIGPTTQGLMNDRGVTYDFKRGNYLTDDLIIEEAVQSLPNNSVTIFKSAGFPFANETDGLGWLHRRPADLLRQMENSVRFVMHGHLI